MPELKDCLLNMEAKNIPEEMMVGCFGATVLRTGDLLHIPAGCLVVEKSINDVNLALRSG